MTISDVQSLITNQVIESQDLEYKAAAALSNKEEITKDVSSFANASGGRIIYGVSEFREREKRHLPEKLDPIIGTQFNREYLDQVINNIQPRIVTHKIHPIEVSSGAFVYVVDIPPGNTAHQAADRRYHRRYNFQCLPMADYEIRDVMNRAKQPRITVLFEFEDKGNPNSITPKLVNDSKVIALNVHCTIVIPKHFMHERFFGDALPVKKPEESEFNFMEIVRSSSHFGPIHPGRVIPLTKIWLHQDISRALIVNNPLPVESSPIEWIVYADSSEVTEGIINLRTLWRDRSKDPT